MHIGMISPFWPPLHGGGELYEYRLAKKLIELGHSIKVFTGTNHKEKFFNGDIDVKRHTKYGEFNYFNGNLESKIIHYDYFENAFNWANENKFEIILIGNAMHNGGITHSRELFLCLKAIGIKVGLIHHDLGLTLENIIVTSYKRDKISWANVAEDCRKSIKQFVINNHDLYAYSVLGSPLFFRPDFIIANSHWSSFFIDPLSTTPKFVLHPILERNQHYIDQEEEEEVVLKPVDILMINPQTRKNPEAMASLIKNNPNLSYRVLKGGWGNSFDTFIPKIQNYSSYKKGRVDLVEYVKDIKTAYKSSRIVFYPSLIEGYGMAAVEPMLHGIPVVSSNYPAILEAVGDSAYSLCPYNSTENEWSFAVNTVLNNRDYWVEKVNQHCLKLISRQDEELSELNEFLTNI